jgi:hypothetical protein
MLLLLAVLRTIVLFSIPNSSSVLSIMPIGLSNSVMYAPQRPFLGAIAHQFRQAIAKTNGLSRAVDLLEETFGLANGPQIPVQPK